MTIKERCIKTETLLSFDDRDIQDAYDIFIGQEHNFDDELQNITERFFITHKLMEIYCSNIAYDSAFEKVLSNIKDLSIGPDDIDIYDLSDETKSTFKASTEDREIEYNMFTNTMFIKKPFEPWEEV